MGFLTAHARLYSLLHLCKNATSVGLSYVLVCLAQPRFTPIVPTELLLSTFHYQHIPVAQEVNHSEFSLKQHDVSLPSLMHGHTFKKWRNGKYILFFFVFLGPYLQPGSNQARGRIRSVATGLRHSHSNSGSILHLRPILQLTAMPDSLTL